MTTHSNSTLNQDLILAARQGLLPVSGAGWLGGFGNLLAKELGEWFGQGRWLSKGLTWAAMINGLMAFILFLVPMLEGSDAVQPENMLAEAWGLYFGFTAIFGIIGAIIAAQDEIIREKQSGTAAWVLSKPVSRQAFILTKLFSNMIGALVIIIALTGILAYLEVYLFSGQAIPVLSFLAGLGVLWIGMVFYLSLTIMLGTFFEQRGMLLGIAVGVFLGGMILSNFIQPIGFILPVNLHQIAGGVALGQPLPVLAIAQLSSAVILSVAFTVIALWRFGREEF
jgi:ABC-2 type transport system permease protein